MEELSPTKSLVAGASISAKAVNQDAFQIIKNTKVPLSAAVVADGLGSHYGAEIASSIAVASIGQSMDLLTSSAELDMPAIFCQASRAIAAYLTSHADLLPPNLNMQNAFGTTGICCAETARELVLSYIGNGAIFHIRGNFTEFPQSQLLPWAALNYLNPHSTPKNGKNALYRILSPFAPDVTHPTVLRITKDDDLFGDIVLICTDGVYSFDQVPMGRDPDRNIWISAEPSILLFMESLKRFFTQSPSQERLQEHLDSYLARLQAANLVTDDCTVCVLMTGKVLQRQRELVARIDAEGLK